jgi:imidazolonepropionase-like amidohydrolase
VYPVSGPAIENGTVLVRDGKIVAVGTNVTVPNDARRIDATGKWVTPGLINAHHHLYQNLARACLRIANLQLQRGERRRRAFFALRARRLVNAA